MDISWGDASPQEVLMNPVIMEECNVRSTQTTDFALIWTITVGQIVLSNWNFEVLG